MFPQISRTPDFERGLLEKRCGLSVGVYGSFYLNHDHQKISNSHLRKIGDLSVSDVCALSDLNPRFLNIHVTIG